MHFIALRRGCSESNSAFLGFGTALLLLRCDFSRYPTEISQAENDHSSFRNISLSTQKLFGEVISLPGPPIQLSAGVAHTGPVLNFGDLVRASVLLVYTTMFLLRNGFQ